MDPEMKLFRSLPPLVEGKIHGYLKLVVDEVIWLKKSPGEVRVFASWWGESDSAYFKPTEIGKNDIKLEHETTEVYAIRTNVNLFEEYIKNCETVELVIVAEKDNTIVGTSQITDLLNIFEYKPCFKYFPMLNEYGKRIGEIHVCIKLMHQKTNKNDKKLVDENVITSTLNKTDANKKAKIEESDIYKSILKSKRAEFHEPLKKFNNEVTDKLVAQVVARAQRLRGAILKETYNEDSLALSDTSLNECLQTFTSPEDEAKLYEYFLGKEMTSFDERRALNTLRSTSPTSSLIDLASKSIAACRNDKKRISPSNTSSAIVNCLEHETVNQIHCSKPAENILLNHIDSIRIFVESINLSPAGYRRVKSSSLSRNDSPSLSVTYIVQYDTAFGYVKQNGKPVKDNRPIKISSKRQIDQVITFNHDGIYDMPKPKLHMDYPIKFKVFVRHLNQKSPTELGVGSMCISDIMKSESFSVTQRISIVNKGIKIGDLNVTAELGSDSIHFGKQYVDGIMSAKENIPVIEIHPLLNIDSSKRSKSATGTQSKSSSRVSSAKEVDCLNSDNNTDLFAARDMSQNRKGNMEDRRVDAKNLENSGKDKVLLHGLIYVAEGKELPELNTYLICRAFWRQDKSTSQICNNTKNPFYHFCQLVPLIHGSDLLDRIKDNYVVIEVYCRNNDVDNLLGLAKLSLHQLYIAYRDPLVLPHLLLSKYPVISVDGWVSITNPVTGQSCGELLALVALGTAEQIALLEMSRGLRNINAIPQSLCCPQNYMGCTKHTEYTTKYMSESQPCVETYPQDFTFRTSNTMERELHGSSLKTQESQTDISTVKQSKFGNHDNNLHSEQLVLHSLVDRLAQVLTAGKTNIDQAAQTEVDSSEKKQTDVEEQICLNELKFNNTSDDSDSSSLRNNCQLPTEMYRSVGVGAEYDEDLDHQPTTDYTVFDLPVGVQHTGNEQIEPECNRTAFRAVVEIECALHLPKVEKANETVEPSTYVSFQANKSDVTNHLNSYVITNVHPHSCNPKWNWKCDTRLSTELLLNDEKRLILKVWRIIDPDNSMQVNLEKDIVIGFSAIDLSVLVTGFPTVSGWFHIMDFTGKCNGQIKVCITPLDNLTSFAKSMSTLSTTRIPANVFQLSWSPSYSHEMRPDVEQNNISCTSSTSTNEESKSVYSEIPLNEGVVHIGHGFEDVSMSFLSLSLKQKLTELDQITKRLESRLRDVTNTAFDDDFENEFDLNEPNSDNENSDQRNPDAPVSSISHGNSRMWQMPEADRNGLYDNELTQHANGISSTRSEVRNHLPESHTTRKRSMNYDVVDTGSSKISSSYMRSMSNDNYQMHQNEYSLQNDRPVENTDYPVRGTKTHINHLLDKLSLQVPIRSMPSKSMPMRKNIVDLLRSLHQNNNNIQNNIKCNQQLNVCSVPTQTDNTDESNTNFHCQVSHSIAIDEMHDRNSVASEPQAANKISTVIREELIAEENNDTSKCDELTTYLITSNVRHMDLDNMFNPLLYQHMVPDLHLSNTVSPEGEAVEQLDNRYAKAFNASIDNRFSKVQNTVDLGVSTNDRMQDRQRSALVSPDNAELFRMTPSGVSENVDGNIDLTVVHKSSYNDLMASNSTESTTVISPDKSIKHSDVEMTDNSYSTSSGTCIPALSRQAPDGGNPIEDITKPLVVQQQDDIQDSSSSS